MEDDNTLKTSSETQDSLYTIDSRIDRSVQARQRVETILISAASLLILLVVFYLFLPSFQAKNMEVNGNVCFTSQDLYELSGNKNYLPLAFFDETKSSSALLENGKGLILSSSYENNGFYSELSVKEDYPKGKLTLSGTTKCYLSSGIDIDESYRIIDSLSLESDAKEDIKASFKDMSSHLPTIHIPSKVTDTESEKVKEAFSPLSDIPYRTLSVTEHLVYKNESENATWNNVYDLILKDDDNLYAITGFLADKAESYFSNENNFPKAILKGAREEAKSMSAVKYEFDDGSESLDVYRFRIVLQNDTVKLVKAE